jgi:hypothetical protein
MTQHLSETDPPQASKSDLKVEAVIDTIIPGANTMEESYDGAAPLNEAELRDKFDEEFDALEAEEQSRERGALTAIEEHGLETSPVSPMTAAGLVNPDPKGDEAQQLVYLELQRDALP